MAWRECRTLKLAGMPAGNGYGTLAQSEAAPEVFLVSGTRRAVRQRKPWKRRATGAALW